MKKARTCPGKLDFQSTKHREVLKKIGFFVDIFEDLYYLNALKKK
jgi:hypothetical protein